MGTLAWGFTLPKLQVIAVEQGKTNVVYTYKTVSIFSSHGQLRQIVRVVQSVLAHPLINLIGLIS